ncbi:hypothetical protein SAMN05192558_113135 [Actinokineospora alba]|uniref:Uncharacterized protein n=1 Tax=Actinokineospora alba TaxID=504798 RepID=A0A1H0VA23_9PSEU|nr:hypothetical protein [Actinokineospora alba]TDP65582.1 hypothetical protein C8E96_1068 [Actinokineospora alba]SDH65987.1 hypothetical protein SAMN05421871_101889 [Actinokineospora alba]SDP75392.1 hypothetical protein SAMN05192558_113135 [Actinokineospora alba]
MSTNSENTDESAERRSQDKRPPSRRASDRLPCGHYEEGVCNDNCDCYYD